jgi:FMN phosphatase YigB (HAD superfamily)
MDSTENKGSWAGLTSIISKNAYLHFSFDFWNTMVFPNPRFKEKRAELISQLTNKNYTPEAISKAFAKVGEEHNRLIEIGGKNLPIQQLYQRVLIDLGWAEKIDLTDLVNKVEQIFLQFPPTLCEDFLSFLNFLLPFEKTISITSNTAFISGATIREFLNNYSLAGKFDFCLFSDEVGYGKPAVEMFQLLSLKLKEYHPEIRLNEVIHIGDNPVTDFIGPMKFGFDSFLLTSEQYLIYPRYSVHSIKDPISYSFSPEAYSRFKFGDFQVAENFSFELFNYFIQSGFFRSDRFPEKIVVYSSPYSQIPTASYFLAFGFFKLLKDHIDASGASGIHLRFGKIDRCQTYTEDYGAMDASERFNLIKNDTYKFSQEPEEDECCIFIDDISITGSHQLVVENMLVKNRCLNQSIFLYFAKLDELTIPASIENVLNFSFVDSIEKLLELVTFDSFRFTTRMIKYVLNASENDFNLFFETLMERNKKDFLFNFYDLALSNDYHKIEAYQKNWGILEVMKKKEDFSRALSSK